MLLEVYKHIETQNPNTKVLTQALTLKDYGNLAEPPLIKAMRKDRYDILEILLQINKKILTYDALCLTDEQGKNVLHHAVIKQHSDIVKTLIYLDSDFGKLRNQKDSKGKTPQTYDDKGHFKEMFETVWDSAKTGYVERLKQLVAKTSVDEQTAWNKNTPLHIAVKNSQIVAVKVLVWDLNANSRCQNANDQTPIAFCSKFIKDEST